MGPEPNYDRPDSKIGQSPWENGAPKGVFIGLGIGSVVLAIVIVALVIRSKLRAKRGDDLVPISSRGGSRTGPPSTRPPRP